MNKILGIIILFFGLIAVVMTYQEVTSGWYDKTQSEQIKILWSQDTERLVHNKSLPKEWNQISEIKYFPLTDSVKELLTKIHPPLETHMGNYRMEVTIDDWKDGSDYGLMIQYQMFDIASDNLVWELGRTLIIPDSKIVEKAGDKLKDKPETSNAETPSTEVEQKPSSDKTK